MLYVDTSALVALIVPEPGSAAVARWYASATGELVSAVWCITEFASALGIKQRTGQLDSRQAQQAWLAGVNYLVRPATTILAGGGGGIC